MNFDFSEELDTLRDQARRFLDDRCPPTAVRRVLEGEQPFDRTLWDAIAELGWPAAAIPESYGGLGLGHEALCVLAEEMGRALAPVPYSSSVYLAAEAIALHGSEAQRQHFLPQLASGARIGTFALAEGPGNPASNAIKVRYGDGKLSGEKWPVLDGSIAHVGLVVARDESGSVVICLVDLDGPGVSRTALDTLDPSRDMAQIHFDSAPAQCLGDSTVSWSEVEHLLDRAAVLVAFEQLGGASACLDMATAYAKERHAFGRPIGSFQAIKHKLADMFVTNELARSNAYYGAWALASNAAELPLAASAARLSAIKAFDYASRENIQTHGGMGFTWEMDCHLFYRRAKLLSGALGSSSYWQERLVSHWESR